MTSDSQATEEQVGAHHCTPGAIQALLADLDAIGECRESPPLQDRDHRTRACVVACVIRHLQNVGVRLAGEKFILKGGLREAREYILDNGNDRTMAPVIERIDDALQNRPAGDVPAPPQPPAPPPMRYIKEGVHVAGCEHGVKIGTHCPQCDAMESKHSTRPCSGDK